MTFKPGTSIRAIRAAVARAKVNIVERVPQINAYLLGVDPRHRSAALNSLKSSPAVASASQELLAEAFDTNPDDTDWPQQQGLRVAGFPKAWDVTRGSSRVVIAVVDTGVDPRQPDLRGALVPGYDFVHSRATPNDDHGHGTAVAGIIAARGDNHEGAAGVCWRCSIMPIKVLDSTGTGDDTVIAAGIVWAADHGAQVINLSLGGAGSSQELTDAIGYAVGKGVVLVAAAGNSGSTDTFYPAADPRAISVAATTVADRRYSWSNFGAWVDLAAPGCNIAPVLSEGYGDFCGTSSATPVVAGLIALELSAQPTLTAGEAEQALEHAAVPLPGLVRYGRIDAARTLSLIGAASPTPANVVFTDTISRRTGTRAYRLAVARGRLTATLVFTGTSTLALSLTPLEGKRSIPRSEGTTPLQLQATLPAGVFVLRVMSRAKSRTSFTLDVSYPMRPTP